MGPEGGSYSWYRNRIFQNFDEMKGDHPAGIKMKVAHTAGKNAILARLSFSPKRSRPHVYSGFSDFQKNKRFSQFGPVEFPGGSREGPERCIGRLESLLGGPRET